MLDLLLVNPAAYRGAPRRGPYELAELRAAATRAGASVDLLDLQDAVGRDDVPFPARYLLCVAEILRGKRALVLFITLRTTGGPWGVEIARIYRSIFKDAVIVAYAPRIELRLRRFMQRGTEFDALVAGDAEPVIPALIRATRAHGRSGLEAVPGLVVRLDNGDLRETASLPRHRESEPGLRFASPWISPDRSIAALHVGRGCPDRCTFCAAHLGLGAHPRYSNPEDAARYASRSFDLLDPQTPRFVMLETENLTSNRPFIERFVAERSRLDHRFWWGAYGRIDHIDESMCQLLASGGCRFLFIGLESGAERVRKLYAKRFDPDQVVARIRMLQAARILTNATFILGAPGETRAEFEETAAFVAKVAWAGCCIDWTPLRIEAGTTMERLAEGTALRLLKNTELYRDLKAAGIDPDTVDPDIGYRMYGLEALDFDIDRAIRTAAHWRALMNDAPMTAYALNRGVGLPIGAMLLSLDALDTEDPKRLVTWAMRLSSRRARDFVGAIAAAELKVRTNSPVQITPFYKIIRRDPSTMRSIFGLDWWASKPSSAECVE